MRIAIVGPGIMPIPPSGWGAVEILIWDSKVALEKLGHQVKIVNTEYYTDLSGAKELDLDYLYDNRSYVLGSMFGGHKNAVPKVCDMVEDIFLNEMIKKGNVNNEQIALGYLIKKYPDEFATYERTNGKHMALFEELG